MAKQPDVLKQVLRDKLGMAPSPGEKLQQAWSDLEEAIGVIADGTKQLQQEAGDLDQQDAIAVGIEALATGLEGVLSAVGDFETLLVEAGVIEDDELLEPPAAADA
jgi:hypothetical protein